MLIETEADHAFKGILRQEKDVCFQKLLALTPTQNPQTPQENQKQKLSKESSLQTPTNAPQAQEQQTSKQQVIPQVENPQPVILLNQDTEQKQQVSTAQALRNVSKNAVLAKDLRIADPARVTLHNDIYKVNLGKLGAWESNLLFALFNRLKDQGDTCIRFEPHEVKEMIGTPKIDGDNLLRVVRTLWKNIRMANFWKIMRFVENGEELTEETNCFLFKHFTIVSDKTPKLRYIEVGINTPYFIHLLNNLSANFTSLQLKIFISLRSKYAKALYRLLVRFEDVKKHCMCEVLTYKSDFEGFKEFMGVSKSMQICMIEERVLKPACRELGVPIDEGYNPENPDRSLPYETIFYTKIKKGKGNKVVGITFHFMPHPHLDMQKAIMKRHTQNRFKDTMAQIQKEEKEKQEKKAREEVRSKRDHYNKQELKILNSFIGLSGPLFTKDFEYHFKSVKLLMVASFGGDNARLMGVFKINTTDHTDRSYAERLRSLNQAYLKFIPKGFPDCFIYFFEDHESLLREFVKRAK
ncbi:replication initiation protein [Helicobacter heilmannii]|uniref:replication initiation protein n=1 Tax=Helicobacter heilmannii TaxID=35817 RepID=UPI001EE308E3|nr:replication initiation protein [Helicobacter heilmannii]